MVSCKDRGMTVNRPSLDVRPAVMPLVSYRQDTQASISASGVLANLHPLVSSPLDGAFWGPWYLTSFGMLVRDWVCSKRAYDQAELDVKDKGIDQSDSPVWTARSFEQMLDYLPCVLHLASNFTRTDGGVKVQKANIYYIIEGDTKNHEESTYQKGMGFDSRCGVAGSSEGIGEGVYGGGFLPSGRVTAGAGGRVQGLGNIVAMRAVTHIECAQGEEEGRATGGRGDDNGVQWCNDA
ncbi:hypothetical protein DFH06DRAFT_1130485 [Mycena polygramma]|nr:hypothetical protein DFH06DRAFT_1130485 [Mycena polygramma]